MEYSSGNNAVDVIVLRPVDHGEKCSEKHIDLGGARSGCGPIQIQPPTKEKSSSSTNSAEERRNMLSRLGRSIRRPKSQKSFEDSDQPFKKTRELSKGSLGISFRVLKPRACPVSVLDCTETARLESAEFTLTTETGPQHDPIIQEVLPVVGEEERRMRLRKLGRSLRKIKSFDGSGEFSNTEQHTAASKEAADRRSLLSRVGKSLRRVTSSRSLEHASDEATEEIPGKTTDLSMSDHAVSLTRVISNDSSMVGSPVAASPVDRENECSLECLDTLNVIETRTPLSSLGMPHLSAESSLQEQSSPMELVPEAPNCLVPDLTSPPQLNFPCSTDSLVSLPSKDKDLPSLIFPSLDTSQKGRPTSPTLLRGLSRNVSHISMAESLEELENALHSAVYEAPQRRGGKKPIGALSLQLKRGLTRQVSRVGIPEASNNTPQRFTNVVPRRGVLRNESHVTIAESLNGLESALQGSSRKPVREIGRAAPARTMSLHLGRSSFRAPHILTNTGRRGVGRDVSRLCISEDNDTCNESCNVLLEEQEPSEPDCGGCQSDYIHLTHLKKETHDPSSPSTWMMARSGSTGSDNAAQAFGCTQKGEPFGRRSFPQGRNTSTIACSVSSTTNTAIQDVLPLESADNKGRNTSHNDGTMRILVHSRSIDTSIVHPATNATTATSQRRPYVLSQRRVARRTRSHESLASLEQSTAVKESSLIERKTILARLGTSIRRTFSRNSLTDEATFCDEESVGKVSTSHARHSYSERELPSRLPSFVFVEDVSQDLSSLAQSQQRMQGVDKQPTMPKREAEEIPSIVVLDSELSFSEVGCGEFTSDVSKNQDKMVKLRKESCDRSNRVSRDKAPKTPSRVNDADMSN